MHVSSSRQILKAYVVFCHRVSDKAASEWRDIRKKCILGSAVQHRAGATG